MKAKIIECINASFDLPVPSQPGLYAIRLKTSLPGFAQSGQWIYLGKSESSLAGRDISTHFRSGKTGSSTLRRSLGAILKDKLRLTAIPRGNGKTEKDCINYKFTEVGEETLTQWMLNNLDIGFWAFNEDLVGEVTLRDIEGQLLEKLGLPLDLDQRTRRNNPNADKLMALRLICRLEALMVLRGTG